MASTRSELADQRSETASPQHVERGVADFAGDQPLDQPDPGCRVFGRHGEIPGDDDLAVQHFGYRNQLAGQAWKVPLLSRSLAMVAEPIRPG